MAFYKNILLTVDLIVTHDEYTIKRAVELAKNSNATLHAIHVMPTLYYYNPGQGDVMPEFQTQMLQDARKIFEDLTASNEFLREKFILETGSPKLIIIEQAKKLNIDLIIVGAHKTHGLNSWLGSTANAVINNAHCDVLTIRTPE